MAATTDTTPTARPHCLAPSRAAAGTAGAAGYSRLFGALEPLGMDGALVAELGCLGGACDASPLDVAGEEPVDEATGAAGWPFFGQFIAHDITADRSPLRSHADAGALRNARGARIDLECLYGDGPVGHPFLYERDDPARLLLGVNDEGRHDDLPRNAEGTALVGDPRNDSHLFMAQLQVAMIGFHNAVVARLRASGGPEGDVFEAARRDVRFHVQWIVLHDYLPRLVGDGAAAALREAATRRLGAGGPDRRDGAVTSIPFEFADAAYRYGHSQIRHRYRTSRDSEPVPMFPDLVGFGPVPAARTVDWSLLFELPGAPPPQRARKIDGRLPRSLIELPEEITGAVPEEERSLALRDLERGMAVGLPSGEAVARHLGVALLESEETGLPQLGWAGETPLWLYVLKEAEAREDGERLGPVGGRIVGEVLVGIVAGDPGSHLAARAAGAASEWTPTLPGATPGDFTLSDLLALAAQADERG